MLSKGDLEALADARLQDAILLLQVGRSSSAYYLAGYAVELALKACIAKLFQPDVILDRAFVNAIYTHKLLSLVNTAGLTAQHEAEIRADPQFATYWTAVSQWSEE